MKRHQSDKFSVFERKQDLIDRSLQADYRMLDSVNKNQNVLLSSISILLVAEGALFFGLINLFSDCLHDYLAILSAVFASLFLFHIVPLFLVSISIRPHRGSELVSPEKIYENKRVTQQNYVNAIDNIHKGIAKSNDERYRLFAISNLLSNIALVLESSFFIILICLVIFS